MASEARKKERPGFNRAVEYYEQLVIADVSHRTSARGAIPYAKELDATQPGEPELDAIQPWEPERDAIRLAEREQDETRCEEQELGETRCEALVAIPFSARCGSRFALEPQCEFPLAVPFLLPDEIRFSSRGGWQCESPSGEPVVTPYEEALHSWVQAVPRFLLEEPRGSSGGLRFGAQPDVLHFFRGQRYGFPVALRSGLVPQCDSQAVPRFWSEQHCGQGGCMPRAYSLNWRHVPPLLD